MESNIHQSLRLLSLTHHFWFRKITISPILHRFIEWRTFHPPKNLSYPDLPPCPLIIEYQFYFIIKWVKWLNYLFFRIFRIFATFYNFTFYMKWRCYSIMLNMYKKSLYIYLIWWGVWWWAFIDGDAVSDSRKNMSSEVPHTPFLYFFFFWTDPH